VAVVVVGWPFASVDVYVNVAPVPVRNAFANATAFSCDPASVTKGYATFPATNVCPVVAAVVTEDVLLESVVVCAAAFAQSASATITAQCLTTCLLMVSLHWFARMFILFRPAFRFAG
jgi:hypothetical protein